MNGIAQCTTSSLAQGCTGQLTALQVERFDAPLPAVRAFDPPVATPYTRKPNKD